MSKYALVKFDNNELKVYSHLGEPYGNEYGYNSLYSNLKYLDDITFRDITIYFDGVDDALNYAKDLNIDYDIIMEVV